MAVEKVEVLLGSGANVSVIAMRPLPEMQTLADEGRISLTMKEFEEADLDGCFLVISASGDEAVDRLVFDAAEARSTLVNVVDVPSMCSFIMPAIHRDGPVAVAISTSGASPALAKRMKAEVAEHFPAAYARLAEMLLELRPWARSTLSGYEERKQFFEEIVGGDPDPIERLAAGDEDAIRHLIEAAQRRATGA